MKSVVILTQPRSGSSLLAGMLHKLGVFMGPEEDLARGKHKNKFGSFENHSFIKITHRILFKSKRLMLYWKRLDNKDGKVEKAVKYYEKDLIKIIKENERDVWGFKEAVIINILPYFHQHLTNPYYIVLTRDPESVVNSQIKASKNFENWKAEIKIEFSYFKPFQRFLLFLQTLRAIFTKGFIYRNKKILLKVTLDAYKKIDDFVKDKKYIRLLAGS